MKQPTILLVEDDNFVRTVMQEVLEKTGYRVLAAASGAETESLVHRQTGAVDLLITDVVLPGMNGRELAVFLKKKMNGMKVIFMSGFADHPVLRDGAPELKPLYLQKPFTGELLVEKVREVLSSRLPAETLQPATASVAGKQ